MRKLEFLKIIIPSVWTHSSSVGTSFDIPRILPLVTTSMNLKSNHFLVYLSTLQPLCIIQKMCRQLCCNANCMGRHIKLEDCCQWVRPLWSSKMWNVMHYNLVSQAHTQYLNSLRKMPDSCWLCKRKKCLPMFCKWCGTICCFVGINTVSTGNTGLPNQTRRLLLGRWPTNIIYDIKLWFASKTCCPVLQSCAAFLEWNG